MADGIAQEISDLDRATGADAQSRDVSVILFVGDHERSIRRCLDGLAVQRGRFSGELVIVDTGGSDHTLDIVREWEGDGAFQSVSVVSDRPGPWYAVLPSLLTSLTSEYVAITSADLEWCRPDRIAAHLRFLKDHGECFACASNYLTRFRELGRFEARMAVEDTYSLVDAPLLLRNMLIMPPGAYTWRRDLLSKLPVPRGPWSQMGWALSLRLGEIGVLGISHEIMCVQDDWSTLGREARDEVEWAHALAHLRSYDEYTNGIYRQDFEDLARALRGQLAKGAEW